MRSDEPKDTGPGHQPDPPATGADGTTGPPAPGRIRERAARVGEPARRIVRKVVDDPGISIVHPALIPGIGVERTKRRFKTDPMVFAVAAVAVLGVILWAVIAPDNIKTVGDESLAWVTDQFAWMYTLLALGILAFMLVLGYGRTGGVRLGADDEAPEFSTVSWVAMLFSAGMGIGLLFYGPYEPLQYLIDPPPGSPVDADTVEAANNAMAQTMLHWGPIAWAFYALVGGAIAYSAYRRGRRPLISAIFEPLFGRRTEGPLGAVIDIFAIIVTLFGTAISLGIGALQIATGTEVVTGAGKLGNGFIIGTMAVLTAAFIASAVSGVKRGIRMLSNLNMIVAGLLALFVAITGPTLFMLNLIPSGAISFVKEVPMMMIRTPEDGEATSSFLGSWTTYYWAWWVSWTPFVGMFIAKISRGRTLREFVTVVILVPAGVCFAWFTVFGGASMKMEIDGKDVSGADSSEAMLFDMLGNLPWAGVTAVIAMVSIIVFFVTSADSASIVMGSISQRGRPEPTAWVTIVWGVLLALTAGSLLLAGGEDALGGLQSIMVVTSLPFAIIVIGMMISWAKDLRTDPYVIRRQYANAAIAQGVRLGIVEHGDDFAFSTTEVAEEAGAGAWLDSTDPELTDWYVKAADETSIATAEDIRRTLTPGAIQPKGPERPDLTASGDEATTSRARVERLEAPPIRRRVPTEEPEGDAQE